MNCLYYELCTLWNVYTMKCVTMKCVNYELCKLWNVYTMNCVNYEKWTINCGLWKVDYEVSCHRWENSPEIPTKLMVQEQEVKHREIFVLVSLLQHKT